MLRIKFHREKINIINPVSRFVKDQPGLNTQPLRSSARDKGPSRQMKTIPVEDVNCEKFVCYSLCHIQVEQRSMLISKFFSGSRQINA